MNEIIIFLLLSLIGIVIFIIFYLSKKEKLDNFSTYLLILASCIITFGFYAPFAFTDKDNVTDFINTGQIGDTFGGIMNPFISIAAIIVTGLAFYAQYRANEMVRKQFELQKFETQFYEMLRLHKENVNEIEIEDINGKIIKGREAFWEMRKEFLTSLSIIHINSIDDIKETYKVFFWGLNRRRQGENEVEKKLLKAINDLEIYYHNQKNLIVDVINKFEVEQGNALYKNEYDLNIYFLKGHHSYLGYYYRHLFHTVKFVVNQNESLISEKEKLKYLRILRAQLSNYEQEMLFYNWLIGYGSAWEDDSNQFFTKYKMIHNMWYSELYENSFIENKIEELKSKYRQLTDTEDLFEIDEK